MKENYSIQAENLMNSIYEDYIHSIKIFHEIRITLNLLKKIKFKVKDRYRRLEDFSDIKIDKNTRFSKKAESFCYYIINKKIFCYYK